MDHLLTDLANGEWDRLGASARTVAGFYQGSLEESQSGFDALAPLLLQVSTIDSYDGLIHVIGHLHQYEITTLFGLGAWLDPEDSHRVIAQAFQGSVTLDTYKEIPEDYRTFLQSLFVRLGQADSEAKGSALAVIEVETALQAMQMSEKDLGSPDATVSVVEAQNLGRTMPRLRWDLYFQSRELDDAPAVNFASRQYFDRLDTGLEQIPLDKWKPYLYWTTIRLSENYLSAPWVYRKESARPTTVSAEKRAENFVMT